MTTVLWIDEDLWGSLQQVDAEVVTFAPAKLPGMCIDPRDAVLEFLKVVSGHRRIRLVTAGWPCFPGALAAAHARVSVDFLGLIPFDRNPATGLDHLGTWKSWVDAVRRSEAGVPTVGVTAAPFPDPIAPPDITALWSAVTSPIVLCGDRAPWMAEANVSGVLPSDGSLSARVDRMIAAATTSPGV